MTTLDDARQTLQKLTQQAQSLPVQDRKRLLVSARKLASSLEAPNEIALRQVFESHTYSLAIRLGAELGFFRVLVKRDGVPISSAELAAECKMEELLLVRVMRVLTALEYAAESSESEYIATPLSRAMVIPHVEAFAIHSHENASRVANFMPEYFSKYGYASPTDGANGPYQYALNTDLPYFDYIHADPMRAERFNICMTGSKGTRRYWFEWFPIGPLLEDFNSSATSDSTFLVDMGGGKGHHLERLLKDFPDLGGHLVLQDLPGTIAGLDNNLSPKKSSAIGAFIYYAHFVLHDFPDDKCRTLLREVAAVMKPGYSKLLLNEVVIPERDCPLFYACADISMMGLLAGVQRSRKHWIELVESAGLKVVEVWESPDFGDMEGVIEAVV